MSEENLNNNFINEETAMNSLSCMPIDEEIYDLADFYKLFSDSTRLKILMALGENELCVSDLANILNMGQSAISHQLRILKQGRLVKNRRDGKVIYYELDDTHIKEIICSGLDHIRE